MPLFKFLRLNSWASLRAVRCHFAMQPLATASAKTPIAQAQSLEAVRAAETHFSILFSLTIWLVVSAFMRAQVTSLSRVEGSFILPAHLFRICAHEPAAHMGLATRECCRMRKAQSRFKAVVCALTGRGRHWQAGKQEKHVREACYEPATKVSCSESSRVEARPQDSGTGAD